MPFVVQVSVADADLRAYLIECVSAMPDVYLTGGWGNSAGKPDLILTDNAPDGADGVPRLYVVDEAPERPVDFVMMPFDARALSIAVRRALVRSK